MQSYVKPKKMTVLPPPSITTQKEWEKKIQSSFSYHKKILRKSDAQHKGAGPNTYDLTDNMVKRRQKALLNSMPEIYKRYNAPESDQPSLGNAWIDLNLPFITYSQMDVQSHILFAASIWILDQITSQNGWQELYRLLPTEDSIIDDLCLHDAWNASYECDLIYSVEYILHNRNPIETDGEEYPRTLTSDYLAGGKKRTAAKENAAVTETTERANYDALIGMIPQEAIDQAVDQFRTYFWQWVDRFYEHAAAFIEAQAENDNELRKTREKYNQLVDEFGRAVGQMERLRKKNPKKPTVSPLMMPTNTTEKMNPDDFMALMTNPPFSGRPKSSNAPKTDYEQAADDALALSVRMDKLIDQCNAIIDKLNDAYSDLRLYEMHMSRQGRIMNDGLTSFSSTALQPMEPMRIEDPYAMCFALLYLTEADDDLPWLYGACCGLMGEVVETLPWGIIEYDELDDDAWGELDRRKLPKSVTIPNAYERTYRMKGDDFDFPRSLTQIIYEETGCILPRDLHIYDNKARLLGKYGIRGKDAAAVLMLMSSLATARRSSHALNFDPDYETFLRNGSESEEPEEETPPEDVNALKEEIKRLKTALHAADRENRETKKSLSGIKAAADREHRELADLREYVFNHTEAVEEEEVDDAIQWPYEVHRDTVVFGGHATWAKGIKDLLTGNIRFIDKDLVFDTALVRHADVIWIQPNALGHNMYYRIVDTARQYGKPVRYFTYASWKKCAEQVAEGDK